MIPFSAPKDSAFREEGSEDREIRNQRNATTETTRNHPTKQIDKQTNKTHAPTRHVNARRASTRIQRMVVFPALSSPSTRIRASLSPNKDAKSLEMKIPIPLPSLPPPPPPGASLKSFLDSKCQNPLPLPLPKKILTAIQRRNAEEKSKNPRLVQARSEESQRKDATTQLRNATHVVVVVVVS